MPLPTTNISLNAIHVEVGGTSGTSVSLNDADVRGIGTTDSTYDGGDGINTTSGTTISIGEFRNAQASVPPALSYVNSKRTVGLVDEAIDNDSQARIFIWCYRTGTTIKVYARAQSNGDSGDFFHFPNLGEGGTETTTGTFSSFHNVNFEFAQITNVDANYKVGFSDASVSGKGNQHSGTNQVYSINMDAGTSPTTAVRTVFWTASAGSNTQSTPPVINAIRYTSEAEPDYQDNGYDRVTLHFRHTSLAAFDVVIDVSTEAEGILLDEGEEDCPQCCIHESMLIATEEDMKSIHDIKIGDKVISYNFETQSNELVEVEDLITIERDVDYKVNNLILTEDHPVYLNTGKKASINPEATLLNYKQEVDKIQIGSIMVKLDGTEEAIETIEKYEGTHLNYAIKTKHNNFYADGILVDSVIQEKK